MIVIDGNGIAAAAFYGTHYHTIKSDSMVFDRMLFESAFIKSLFSTLRMVTGTSNNPVVFCIDSTSWRKKVYPEYKANRKDLKERTPYRQYIESFHAVCGDIKALLPLVVLKKAPYEADDLLAYFASKATKAGSDASTQRPLYPVLLVTSDKDMKQLYNPPFVQLFNHTEDKMTVVDNPKEQLQILICTGDSSDNIPSITPRKADGSSKFRFGEKSIPGYMDAAGKCGLGKAFWSKLTEDEAEKFEAGYHLNSELIDLSRSPVHDENFVLPSVAYSSDNVACFCNTYMPSVYATQGKYIHEMLQSFAFDNCSKI